METLEENTEQNEGGESKVSGESNESALKDHDKDEPLPQNEDTTAASDIVDSSVTNQTEETLEPIKEDSSTK